MYSWRRGRTDASGYSIRGVSVCGSVWSLLYIIHSVDRFEEMGQHLDRVWGGRRSFEYQLTQCGSLMGPVCPWQFSTRALVFIPSSWSMQSEWERDLRLMTLMIVYMDCITWRCQF